MIPPRTDKPWNERDLAELDAGWDVVELAAPAPERISRLRLVKAEPSPALRRRSAHRVHWALLGGFGLLVAGGAGWSILRRPAAPRVVDISVRASVPEVPNSVPEVPNAVPEVPSAAAIAEPSEVDALAEQATKTRRVLVDIEPAGAVIYSGGEKVGTDLVNVELVDGVPQELSIQRKGYVTRTLVVDGTLDFVHVQLIRAPSERRPQRAAKPRPAASLAARPEAESEARPEAQPEARPELQPKGSSEAEQAYP